MTQDMTELLELLEQNKSIYKIFKQCPYDILRTVRVRHYEKGQFVLDQGEVYDTFYIIADGCVDIYVESDQGKKYFLSQYKKGQYIGELEVFGRRPYVSGVEANGKVTILEIDREIFMQWLKIDSNFNRYLLETLCDTSYEMCRNMGENTLYSLKQRICQFLIESVEKSRTMEVPVKTETLGNKMAVTQRSVNRIIKQLKEKEIIDLSKSGVLIKDYEALLEEREKK